MLSYSQSLTLYQKLINNKGDNETAIFNIIFNEKNREVLSSLDWPFLETTKTQDTIASQQFYDLPFNNKKVINVTTIVDTIVYTPEEAPNYNFWNRLNMNTSSTSDIPEYFFIKGNEIGFYPIPSSSDNTININYRKRVKDISINDYTTGDILTATNGDETIVGSSTVWTKAMKGRWLRITDNDSPNKGDGEWYEIDSVTDGTNLELVKKYQGSDIAAGSADYIISQVSDIPEDFQLIPVYLSVAEYWRKEDKLNRATFYENQSKKLLDNMKALFSYKSENLVLDDMFEDKIINPNLQIRTA